MNDLLTVVPDAVRDLEAAGPAGVAAIAAADPVDAAHYALILGIALERPEPPAGLRDAIRAAVPDLLALAAAPGEPGRTLALVFLLGHLPEERAAILAAAPGLPIADDDRDRLGRCLAEVDLDDPELTRVWPHPAVWRDLPEEDRAFDRAWMRGLGPENIAMASGLDTVSLLAYAGALALWKLRDGATGGGPDPDLALPDAGTRRDAAAAPFGTHPAAVFACPACRGGLAATSAGAHCESCGAQYPATRGFLDLSGGVGDQYEPMTRNVPLRYSGIRPAFLRWKGSNWLPLITVEDEDDYLRTHVEPVDGPILDLAAGTGRWTAVLAARFGPERVLALDLSTAMLDEIGRTQPDVVAVRGNALNLPFADASLGAVNCWNALQSLPDPAAAVAEVGRCLRPGGTFTVMTFRPSPDPLTRYFQTRPFGVVPVNLSDPDDLRGWLEKAGLTVREVYTPGTFLFVTAVRADATA